MPARQTYWAGERVGRVGRAYDFVAERERLAAPAGRLLWGTDVRLFYAALRVVGDLPDGAVLLDVPCGGGVALRDLPPDRRIRYVAADISPDMLVRTRRRAAGRPVQPVCADLERLPFADGEFDLCVTFNALHCLPDPAAAVHELARCLRPGARLVGDAVVRGAGRRYDRTFALLRLAGVFGPGGTAAELRGWLSAAGLTVNRLDRSGAVVHFTATRPAERPPSGE